MENREPQGHRVQAPREEWHKHLRQIPMEEEGQPSRTAENGGPKGAKFDQKSWIKEVILITDRGGERMSEEIEQDTAYGGEELIRFPKRVGTAKRKGYHLAKGKDQRKWILIQDE